MTSLSNLPIRVALIFAFVLPVTATAATVCESPQAKHERKMNAYQMPSFPSLLEDCGIDDMLGNLSFDFLGDFLQKIDLPEVCGYSVQDIGGWYGMDLPNSIEVGGSYDFSVDVEAGLFNTLGLTDDGAAEALFEFEVEGGVGSD